MYIKPLNIYKGSVRNLNLTPFTLYVYSNANLIMDKSNIYRKTLDLQYSLDFNILRDNFIQSVDILRKGLIL